MKRAVFPGSFDPITLGHCDIITRGILLFDELVIAVGENSNKENMFTLEQRKYFIESKFKNDPRIKVISYKGLTVDLCRKIGANFILRGARNTIDFEFEKSISQNNRFIGKIETVILLNSPETSFISSSIVREIIKHGGDFKKLVPETVIVNLDR